MIRTLAGGDLDKEKRIVRWPLRDSLIVYEECLKNVAREAYKFDMLIYYLSAPHQKNPKPPKKPDILKED